MKPQIHDRKLHICIGERLAREAAEAASDEGESVSAIMRLALRHWLASRNQPEQRSA